MRYERRERKYKQITARDLRIVEATYETRYITRKMVQKLFFGGVSESNCKTRMRLLFDKGYLKKREVYPSDPDIYFLGLKGKRYMISLGKDKDYVDRVAGVSSSARQPMLMMSHELTLSSLYVEARFSCPEEIELEWRNSRMLELMKLPMQPDAWVRLTRNKVKSAFIEFTDQIPSKREMDDKLKGYARFFETKQMQVLWFTTSMAKLNRLRNWANQSPYRDYYAFALIEDMRCFLTRPIFVGTTGMVSFVTWLGGQCHLPTS